MTPFAVKLMDFFKPGQRIKFHGRYDFEVVDRASGLVVARKSIKNLVPDAAINSIFNTNFNAATQTALWYMMLIDNAGFSAISAADTMTSHSGWVENQQYSQATRPAWGQGSAASKVITNASSVTFSMNATASIKGAAIVSGNVKGATTGLLWSAGSFASGVQSLTSGQDLKLTYTLTGSSS